MCFSTPQPPKPPPPVTVTTPIAASDLARQSAKRDAATKTGFSSTILSKNIASTTATAVRKTLLGA